MHTAPADSTEGSQYIGMQQPEDAPDADGRKRREVPVPPPHERDDRVREERARGAAQAVVREGQDVREDRARRWVP